MSAGLRYVYEGNVPGHGGEDTICYQCGTTLIERYGFTIRNNRINKGACPTCGSPVDGVEMDGVKPLRGRSNA
jgi:pyruvate formate lyase activating enzyme